MFDSHDLPDSYLSTDLNMPCFEKADPAATHWLAGTFLPNLRNLAFDLPIVQAGRLLFVVLSQHTDDGLDHGGGLVNLRVYRSDLAAGEPGPRACLRWRCVFHAELDKEQFQHTRRLPLLAGGRVLSEMARDLLYASKRLLAQERLMDRVRPRLPSTLLAVPSEAIIEAQQSRFVEQWASRRQQADWQVAWRHLYRQFRQPAMEARLGFQFLGSRLLTHWPCHGSVGVA